MTSDERDRVRWERHSWPELRSAARDGAVVIIPVGAIEQHGRHLPVCTDTLIAEELALEVATRASGRVLVTPALPVGHSPYHLHLEGTLSVRREVFGALLTDVCRSVRAHDFRAMFVLNGHGGNVVTVTAAVGELAEEGIFVTAASWWDFAANAIETELESECGGANHACELETSVLLHLAPHLVHLELATKELGNFEKRWGWTDYRSCGAGAVAYPITPSARTPTGVYGDPTLASPAKGKAVVDEAVGQMTLFLDDLRTWTAETYGFDPDTVEGEP